MPAEPPHPDPLAPLWDGDVVTTEDGSRTLHSPRYGQSFRSRAGAHTEARHVFVAGSGVAARLERGLATAVLEVGLGPATNLGLTAAVAWATRAPLRYVAIEREPLPPAAWRALDPASWMPAPFAAAWVDALAAGIAPGERLRVAVGPVDATVWRAEAAELARTGALAEMGRVDAVYLDPFSPDVDPDGWRPEVLAALAGRLAPGGALVSYSVQGAVRRALAAAGLDVARVPGPTGGKREVLRAVRPAPTP